MPGRTRVAHRNLTVAVLLILGIGLPALAQEPARTDGPPYRIGGGVSRPEILNSPKPIYTELARRASITGTVILEAVIDENGNVTEARVLKGLPMGLDRAAVEAVKTWKFAPAVRHGVPVPVYYVLTVNFQIDEGASNYGPLFAEFLRKNPSFATALGDKHFDLAASLLDLWGRENPDDAEVALARIYLLLEQGQVQEAWKEALSYRGAASYEALNSVSLFTWNLLQKGKVKTLEAQAELIELGLQATTAAMAANPNAQEPLVYKRWWLREKADRTLDPDQRQALLDEAEQLQ
jgi:TonB family protein